MTYSLNAIYKNSRWAIGQNSSVLAALQQKAATGQEVNRVSDDPTDSNQILSLISDSRTKEQTLKTLDEVISTLDLSASVIQSITGEFGRARASLTSTLSGTLNVELRQTLAADLDNILEEMVSLANTQRMGQSLFAGANSGQLPYTVERDEQGHITRVNYQGSFEERQVKITDGLEVSAVLAGPTLFSSQERVEPVFSVRPEPQRGQEPAAFAVMFNSRLRAVRAIGSYPSTVGPMLLPSMGRKPMSLWSIQKQAKCCMWMRREFYRRATNRFVFPEHTICLMR